MRDTEESERDSQRICPGNWCMDLPSMVSNEGCGQNWLLGTVGGVVLERVCFERAAGYPSGEVNPAGQGYEHC